MGTLTSWDAGIVLICDPRLDKKNGYGGHVARTTLFCFWLVGPFFFFLGQAACSMGGAKASTRRLPRPVGSSFGLRAQEARPVDGLRFTAAAQHLEDCGIQPFADLNGNSLALKSYPSREILPSGGGRFLRFSCSKHLYDEHTEDNFLTLALNLKRNQWTALRASLLWNGI